MQPIAHLAINRAGFCGTKRVAEAGPRPSFRGWQKPAQGDFATLAYGEPHLAG